VQVDKAMRMGIKVAKFFPAESFGGLKTISAISAPYTQMRFMPTGE
jgi:2-dehydro-3-deoxyphosphogluconate aldolase/(4S)-4-hydroxy-2-oxoglutarate aldolase